MNDFYEHMSGFLGLPEPEDVTRAIKLGLIGGVALFCFLVTLL